MTQPFVSDNRYCSRFWPGLSLELIEDRIQLHAPIHLHTLSSAILPGGFSRAKTMVNWHVPINYNCDNPRLDLISRCALWGLNAEETIAFITAANLKQASIQEVEGDCFNLLVCTTAGTRNAARAGVSRQTYSAYSPGTINTMLAIQGAMTESAMVNAVITATEAKSAALQDLRILEHGTSYGATGTTTDAIAIGVSQQALDGAVHAYAGAATTIGCAIGEAVYQTVLEAAGTQKSNL
ncbi:adenosylcobinamide amidohydrolase [Paenibacillus sp. CAU 1782]